MVDAERTEFADLVDTLTPQQWDASSLCTAWKVRDVVAHVTQGGTVNTGESMKQMVKYGFRLNKLLTEEAKKDGQATSDELRANLRGTVGSRTTPPFTKAEGMLADEVIHQQDVRRAIGIPRQVPTERLRVVLDDIKGYNNVLIPAKKRLKGLHLKATDLDWEFGDPEGAEVSGPGEALMMAISGRSAALADLTGPGVAQLRERITQ